MKQKISTVWLKTISIIITLMGITIFAASLLDNHFSFVTDMFFGSAEVSNQAHRFIIYLYGEYAAATLSFGVFLWFLTSFGIAGGLKWPKYAILFAAGIWTVTVAAGNLRSGVPVLALANTILGVLIILPAAGAESEGQ